MRNLRCYAALPVFLSLLLVLNTCLYAQSKTLDRKYDPVIISADALSGFESSDFAGVPIGQIFAMTFDASSPGWQMIPFQIDERDASGSYFTADPVAGFDANDEFAFMAADAGDSAVGWLNNPDSERYQRFAIKITDPLSPEKKGWVYLYRSGTLSPQVDSYVQYIPPPSTDSPADTVVGVTYKIGASSDDANEASGFFDFISFPQVSNVDLLDRQKVRVSLGLFTIKEDFFQFASINKVEGQVRIIKELLLTIPLVNVSIALPFQFFAYSVEVGGTFDISAEDGLTQISQSLDLSPAATGMQFSSNKNSTAVTIDGIPDIIDTAIDTLPNVNWLLFTGDQGTMINLVKISGIGDEQKLSYLDDSSQDSDDSGDQMHYGDAGVEVKGDTLEGNFPLGVKSIFLEPNQPSSVAEQLAEFEKTPLTVQSSLEDFNTVSVEQEDSGIPQSFSLAQNFPNPFNPVTVIQYQLPGSGLKTARVSLKVYDLLGKEVQTLVDREHAPGIYEIRWDGTNNSGAKVSSGVYIYQLKFRDFTSSKKMILLR